MKTSLRFLAGAAFSVSLTAALIPVAAFYAPEAKAFTVYCTNCSTTMQQALQYAKDVETALNTAQQLQTQMRQYDDMIKQGIALPESLYQSITGDLRRVADVYTNTKTLGRDISDLDKRFREQFKDYDTYLKSAGEFDGGNISERQRKWSEQGFDNATSAMRAAGINVGAFEQEDRALNRVVQQSQNATGRLQAIQAGNEIAAQNVQQLQKLRDLTATQITLQSNYLAATTEKETAKAAADEQYFERKPVRSEKVGF